MLGLLDGGLADPRACVILWVSCSHSAHSVHHFIPIVRGVSAHLIIFSVSLSQYPDPFFLLYCSYTYILQPDSS